MIKKHLVLMILCCLIPLAVLAAIFIFNVPLSTTLLVLVVLLCPLSHIFMMFLMRPGEDHHHGHQPGLTKPENVRHIHLEE
jgi:ABC-type transport system involved in cytochrome bd biosynthesis fused ATPase/permease subunit